MNDRKAELVIQASLGLRLRGLRRAKTMKQSELAKECGVSPGYIGLLETGKRSPDEKLLRTLCSVLQLSAAEEAELRDRSLAAGTRQENVFARVEGILRAVLARLGGKSATLYVRDPFWPDELRLVAMPGIER